MNKFYVTTSIAYVNAEPHIGYAQELLAADVLARYFRERDKDVFYLTGTDEHGSSVQKAAEKSGVTPKEYADKISGKFEQLGELLNISNDGFVRTTDADHIKNVVEIWNRCLEAGDIYKRKYEGLYCIGCEAFYNQKDLVEGKCPNHPNIMPEKIEEENWFFKLSNYREKLLNFYKDSPDFVRPDFRFNEIKNLVESGLEDVSVSRPKTKLNWGIEVPNDADHVMYVWFDALTNYLYPKKYWPADLHVIGKDILRFHAALWPAMLMSAGYELPKQIFVHGFISVEGQKMSKTLGNVVKAEELAEKFGVEATRYLLLKELPFGSDSDFSWKRMEERYNADLANDLGNLLQRTLTMINKYEIKLDLSEDFPKVDEYVDIYLPGGLESYKLAMKNLRFDSLLVEIMAIISGANKLIDDKKPWVLAKEKKSQELEEVFRELSKSIIVVADLLLPFMPDTSDKIKKQLETLKPEPLFPRLT